MVFFWQIRHGVTIAARSPDTFIMLIVTGRNAQTVTRS
jgi:hypothetical protein